jgi:hypothetical protein
MPENEAELVTRKKMFDPMVEDEYWWLDLDLMADVCCLKAKHAPGSLSPHMFAYVCFQVFRMYILFVSYGCCKSRSGDVAHVSYVTIVSEAYCKHMLRVFQMFQRYVLSVFSGRIVASVFIWMLHMFHTYVACVLFGCLRTVVMVFKCFQVFFFQVFQKHILSVSTAFRHMLQLLYLDVSKVDWVLHLSSPPSVA